MCLSVKPQLKLIWVWREERRWGSEALTFNALIISDVMLDDRRALILLVNQSLLLDSSDKWAFLGKMEALDRWAVIYSAPAGNVSEEAFACLLQCCICLSWTWWMTLWRRKWVNTLPDSGFARTHLNRRLHREYHNLWTEIAENDLIDD